MEAASISLAGGSSSSSIYTPRSTHLIYNSKRIDIVFNEYADRFFVIITQMQKIGTLLQVTASDSRSGEGGPRSYDITTLLGKRDDILIQIYARHVIDILHR